MLPGNSMCNIGQVDILFEDIFSLDQEILGLPSKQLKLTKSRSSYFSEEEMEAQRGETDLLIRNTATYWLELTHRLAYYQVLILCSI